MRCKAGKWWWLQQVHNPRDCFGVMTSQIQQAFMGFLHLLVLEVTLLTFLFCYTSQTLLLC
jgi:hypothetical protein